MKVLQEVTEWDTQTAPNHVYFTDDSKSRMYAYVRQGTDQVFRFSKPIGISTKGRKFKEIANRWRFTVDDRPDGRTWTVTGSRGDSYTVSEESGNWSCTCPASKWQKGECKHIQSLKAKS